MATASLTALPCCCDTTTCAVVPATLMPGAAPRGPAVAPRPGRPSGQCRGRISPCPAQSDVQLSVAARERDWFMAGSCLCGLAAAVAATDTGWPAAVCGGQGANHPFSAVAALG